MRIECQCGSRAVVSRSEKESNDSASLFCSCTNPECGHTFVSSLSFKHSLFVPASATPSAPLSASVVGKRIVCSCGERACIQKTNRLSANVADLYCECSGCGHRFVMVRSFSHTLSPSALNTEALIMAIIRIIPLDIRRKLKEHLNCSN